MPEPAETTKHIAQRVRTLRAARRWTAADLGAQMSKVGIPWDRFTVANLESERRQNVSVAEWLALARVLDVAPVHLLVPPDTGGTFHVTPTEDVPVPEAREWVRGRAPLPGTDKRTWYTEVPLAELGGPREDDHADV